MSLTSNDTMGQPPVVCPLLRWPANSRRRNGNLSNLVTIQMEILAGSGQSHCPLPRYVSRSPLALSCRVPVLSDQQHPLLPPETGTETLPVRLQSALKDCVLEGERRGNERIIRTHSESDACNFFICFARKNGDLSSALECLGDERSLKPELGNTS